MADGNSADPIGDSLEHCAAASQHFQPQQTPNENAVSRPPTQYRVLLEALIPFPRPALQPLVSLLAQIKGSALRAGHDWFPVLTTRRQRVCVVRVR
eukprot:19853-Prorocentrum_minimum.AAC.1